MSFFLRAVLRLMSKILRPNLSLEPKVKFLQKQSIPASQLAGAAASGTRAKAIVDAPDHAELNYSAPRTRVGGLLAYDFATGLKRTAAPDQQAG